ncbi:MAG: rimI [Thermoleophilia bacterium]|nr:rimI [Thermoleophilia bacterium]
MQCCAARRPGRPPRLLAMPLLCLDTATASPVVALVDDDGVLLAARVVDGRAQEVLGAIDEVLTEASVAKADLVAVVVGLGPGTFTGLRVGVSTARGIADTLGVPLYGESSLVLAGASHAEAGGSLVRAVIPAGRGESFVQDMRMGDDGVMLVEGGSGVVSVDAAGAATPVTPAGLARAGWRAWQRGVREGEAGDPLATTPDYGRAPDADPPRMDVRHDELSIDDLDALLVLEARCFATPWTREMYAGEFARAREDVVLLAARDAGANRRLVGAALAARIGDCWHVMNVLVDPIARGRGIASRLVEDLLARTRELGAGEGWTLEVRDGNVAAIALYERHGFATVGTRPGYYEDTGDDALVMWLRTESPAFAKEPS